MLYSRFWNDNAHGRVENTFFFQKNKARDAKRFGIALDEVVLAMMIKCQTKGWH